MLWTFVAIVLLVVLISGIYTTVKVTLSVFMKELFGGGPSPAGRTLENEEFARSRLIGLHKVDKISLPVLNEILMILDFRGYAPKKEAEAPPAPMVSESTAGLRLSPPVRTQGVPASPPAASGFMISDNIKMMLISGSALFILGAYLFARSYWGWVPDALKFSILAAVTAAIYAGGYFLLRKPELPKTAESLLMAGILLVPVNVLAANLLLFDRAMGINAVWLLGFAAMAALSLLTSRFLATETIGFLDASSCLAAAYFACRTLAVPLEWQYLFLTVAAHAVLLSIIRNEIDQRIHRGVYYTVNIFCAAAAAGLFYHRFFWDSGNQWITASTLLSLGIFFALESRVFKSEFAYAAGISFMGSAVLLMRYFGIPAYKYGLLFVPGSLIAIFRAWTFERAGRKELAAPYFQLSQIALAGSIAGLFPHFSFYVGAGYSSLLAIQVLAILAYATMGVLYREPVFTYASGSVFLFLLWTFISHGGWNFASGILLFGASAFLMALIGGFLRGEKSERLAGLPFTVIGMGTLSLSLALVAGRWGSQFMSSGAIAPAFPADQLNSGLIISLLAVAAYGVLGWARRQVYFTFPVLASGTLLYLFALEKFQHPINLLNVSWLVPAAMALFYIADSKGWKEFSRCLSIWAELLSFAIGASALASNAAAGGLNAAGVCTLSFLPGLWKGRADLSAVFLFGAYLFHFTWYRQAHPGFAQPAQYALQLVLVNVGVIFIRTLISYSNPKANIDPFRVLSFLFSALSLALSLWDKDVSWIVFLIYGVLAIAVSFIHYEGRHVYVGTTLLLIAYELFLHSRSVDLAEAYSVPAGLYFLASGFFNREDPQKREPCYALGISILYLPSLFKAMGETWELHGVFLGAASLMVMLFGMTVKSKTLTFWSLGTLLLNGAIQSRQFFNAVPRWVYLGTGGMFLVTLGGLFEFKRETLLRMKAQISDSLDDWE